VRRKAALRGAGGAAAAELEGRRTAGSEQTRMAYSRTTESHAEKIGRGAGGAGGAGGRVATGSTAESEQTRTRMHDADWERAARENRMGIRFAAGEFRPHLFRFSPFNLISTPLAEALGRRQRAWELTVHAPALRVAGCQCVGLPATAPPMRQDAALAAAPLPAHPSAGSTGRESQRSPGATAAPLPRHWPRQLSEGALAT